jgi:hypothetical protein
MRGTPKWYGKLSYNTREETQRKTPTDLRRRDTEDFEGKRN